MTKDKIIALISEKIAGQGNQVDISGQLSAILTGIIDLIPSVPAPYELPVATSEVLGGVKVGSGLSVTEEGVLSASIEPLIIDYGGDLEMAKNGGIEVSSEVFNTIKNTFGRRPIFIRGYISSANCTADFMVTSYYMGESASGYNECFVVVGGYYDGGLESIQFAVISE